MTPETCISRSVLPPKRSGNNGGRDFGLDKPLPVQYFIWLGKAARLDFGKSIATGHPAFDTIRKKIPATLQLAGAAWIFALLVGLPLGVLSASKRGSPWDLGGRTFAFIRAGPAAVLVRHHADTAVRSCSAATPNEPEGRAGTLHTPGYYTRLVAGRRCTSIGAFGDARDPRFRVRQAGCGEGSWGGRKSSGSMRSKTP